VGFPCTGVVLWRRAMMAGIISPWSSSDATQ